MQRRTVLVSGDDGALYVDTVNNRARTVPLNFVSRAFGQYSIADDTISSGPF